MTSTIESGRNNYIHAIIIHCSGVLAKVLVRSFCKVESLTKQFKEHQQRVRSFCKVESLTKQFKEHQQRVRSFCKDESLTKQFKEHQQRVNEVAKKHHEVFIIVGGGVRSSDKNNEDMIKRVVVRGVKQKG